MGFTIRAATPDDAARRRGLHTTADAAPFDIPIIVMECS